MTNPQNRFFPRQIKADARYEPKEIGTLWYLSPVLLVQISRSSCFQVVRDIKTEK